MSKVFEPKAAVLALAERFAPNRPSINAALAARRFRHFHGRAPVTPTAPEATINDFIFARMIAGEWTPLHRACVDKVTAKREALALAPGLRVAETRDVIAVRETPTLARLFERLRPHLRTAAFAKPAHASGGVCQLAASSRPQDLAPLLATARADFFRRMRETQYAGLPRRILVEDAIEPPADGLLVDFKFHCAHGEPQICQVDLHMDGATHRRLLWPRSFQPFDPLDGVRLPAAWRLPDPARLALMSDIAAQLARPFDYVRIDLLNGRDGVYFGEFTFTPGAGLGLAPSSPGTPSLETPAHRRYSDHMLHAVRAGPGGVGDPGEILKAAS